MTEYPTVDVSSWRVVRVEAIGADEKEWLSPPSSDEQWLFKANNVHATRGVRWTQREDLAEKVAGELARLAGIPSASIELARREDKLGCISLDLRPGANWELQTGAILLDGLLQDYRPGKITSNKLRLGHSLSNIRKALEGYAAPPGHSELEGFSGFDVFAGYVTFDAIIANRDRHDENWAILRSLDKFGLRALCGSFDHGRALGSTLQEQRMKSILSTGEIDSWVAKGTAWRFEHSSNSTMQTLVGVAADALSMVRASVRMHWLEALSSLGDDSVIHITDQLPAELSDVPSTFMREVIAANRRRVLNDC